MGNVFGLGILLTLDDRASGKVAGFGNSLQQLSAKAMSLNYMGKSLINTGKAMVAPIIGLSKEIIRVGDDAEKTRITLGALYESSEKGAEKFEEIIDYAARTPFGIEELKDATMQFKTLGIELMGVGSQVTDSAGRTRDLIDILGDAGAGLSGVARNGFKDVTYAAREFITEGNKLSTLRRLGVDIDAVLAKGYKAKNTQEWITASVGDTAEERLKNFADLINALKMDDLMGDLSASWATMSSNLGDVWYKFLLKAGDAGAFNVFKEGLQGILEIGKTITDSEFSEQFFLNLGSAFKYLARPLDSVIGFLSNLVTELIKLGASHPMILKLVLAIPAVVGSLFMLSGAALVAKSSMMVFRYGLGVIINMLPQILLLAAVFGAVYTAWTKDIGGIRTKITGFVDTIRSSMSKANEIMGMQTKDMVKSYRQLVESWESTGNFGDGFTAKIISMRYLWNSFWEFWNNHKLTPQTVKALEDMGLLTTFEKIATWTVRIKEFCSGFVQGFSDMANAVMNFVAKITTSLFPSLEGGGGTGLFNKLTGEFDASGVDKAKSIGVLVAKLLPVIWIVKKIFGIINGIRGKKKGSGLSSLLGRLIGGDANGGGVSTVSSLRRLGSTLATLNPKMILKGLANLAIIAGGLTLVALVVGGLASISPGAVILGGLVLASMAVALLPISSPTFMTALDSIKRMAKFKPMTFVKGIANLGVIVGSMSILAMLMGAIVGISPSAFIAGGLAMTAMGALFMAVGNPAFVAALNNLKGIAKLNPKTILKGMANLAIIMGSMSAMFLVLGAISLIPIDIGRVSAIALVLGELGIVGFALAKFAIITGKLKVSNIALGIAGMAIALGGMTAIFGLLAWVSSFNFSVDRISKIAGVLLEIGKVGLALSVMIGLLGAVVAMCGIYGIGAILVGLVVLAAVLAAMSGIMVLVNAIAGKVSLKKMDDLLNTLLKLGAIGTALSVFAGISGLIPLPTVLAGLVNIGLVIEGLAILAQQFSKLQSKAEKIQAGFDMMSQIGMGLGKALGSFVSGIGVGVTMGLPIMGEHISAFMNSISTVATPSEGQQGIGEFLSSLATGLLKLTANDLLSMFTGGTDWEGLATGLSQLTNTKPFLDFCATIPAEAFDGAKKFFEALGDIGNIPNTGGVAQWFSGENDYASLATGLGTLTGDNVKGFFEWVGSIPESAFTGAKGFFQALADVGNIPNTGGVAQWFSGTNDYAALAQGLGDLSSDKVKGFFNWAAGIKASAFTGVKGIFNSLKGIGEAFPNTGGIAQLFTGENDITGVAESLSTFHTKTKAFFASASTIKVGNLDGIWYSIQKAGYAADTDLDGLSDIGSELSVFVTTASTFLKNVGWVGNLDWNKFNGLWVSTQKAGYIASLDFSELPTVGTYLSDFIADAKTFFTEAGSLTGYSESVNTLATALSSFYNVINTIVVTGITNLNTTISGVLTSITGVNTEIGTLSTSFVALGATIVTTGTSVATSLTSMATTSASSTLLVSVAFNMLKTSIAESSTSITSGLSLMVASVLLNTTLMTSAITALTTSCGTLLSTFADSGTSYGSTLVTNIASGITNNAWLIRSAIKKAITNAARSVSISVPVNVGQNYNGTDNWIGGLTTINERGGELVDLPSGTRIYPHDKSVTMAFDEGVQTAMAQIKGGTTDSRSYDDSVHFYEGSIVVQANGASEAEAERLATLIMEKIDRKNRRKALATYQY